MGSLVGRVAPGIVFMFYGGYWIFMSFWLYLTTSLKLNSRETGKYADVTIKSKSYIPVAGCSKVPIEPILKIIVPTLGILMEDFFTNTAKTPGTNHIVFGRPWSVYNEAGRFNVLVKLQHMTMHSCFIVSGIIDLLSICIKYPKHTSQLFLSLALLVESTVFYFHTDGRDSLDTLIHQLLTIAIVIGFVSAALRMVCATNLLVNATLGLSLTLQGTWLIEAGVVLYGQTKWEREDHNNNMFIVACFIWHMMIIAVGMLVFYTLMMIGLKYHKLKRSGREWGFPLTIEYQQLPNEEFMMQNLNDSNC